MANCTYCGSFILLGGKTDQTGTGRYCNDRCQQAGNFIALSAHVPRQHLDRMVEELYRGNCPRCGAPGPIDVHKAHQVWSALILTSWSSKPELSCKSCATKRQLGAMVFSGVLGWWGFPWGLILTPVQVARNIAEMAGGPKTGAPSELLHKYVRIQAGAQVWQQAAQSQSARPPIVNSSTPPPTIPPKTTPGDDSRYMPKS
jgi:hypothetical protein